MIFSFHYTTSYFTFSVAVVVSGGGGGGGVESNRAYCFLQCTPVVRGCYGDRVDAVPV